MNGTNFDQTLNGLQSLGLRCCLASFVVMLVAWFVVLCLRNHSAALRHRILCLGLAGVVMLPVVVLVSQDMSPTLRMAVQQPVESTETQAVEEVGKEQRQEPSSLPESYAIPFTNVNDASPTLPTVESEPAFVLPEDVQLAQAPLPVEKAESESRVIAFSMPTISLSSVPFLVWIFGVVVLLARALLERCLLMRTLRRSIEVTDQGTLAMMQSIAKDHGIREASLLCSESLQVPVAIGVLRPAIVLPVGYGKWSDDRLQIVLLHEMMHIGRADVLAQSVAGLACTLFWFNPLTWRAASRMRLERELASDDSVLLAGEDAVNYADHLLDIAAAISPRFRVPAAASAMATHTNLHSRVSRLMRNDIDRTQLSRRMSHALLLLAFLLVTLLTFATPAIAMTPDDTPATAPNNATDLRSETVISGELDADWLAKLKAMPNLKKLTIRGPRKNFQASALGQLTGLQSLQVEDLPLGTPMADIIMVNIARINGLRDVSFKATGLTSNGLSTIGGSSITSLSLVDEEMMTDDGFQHVAKIQTLERLYLSGTPIEAPGLEFLQSSRKLKSFALLRDPGATKRLPVIARFPSLVDLELFEEDYPSLVVLKQLKTLRRLTLRYCGAFKASESLEQLSQLDRVELDNADIRNETFDEVKSRLAKAGIKVVDITRAASIPHSPTQLPNEATKLARKVHREMDFAKHHPTFWVRWRDSQGDISSMDREPIRTLHKLKKALNEPSVSSKDSYDQQDHVMAWSPANFYHEGKYVKEGRLSTEYYKYGGKTVAWARERYQAGESPHYYLRKGAGDFADSLDDLPPTLKVSLQSYWWGTGKSQWTDINVATNPFSAESVTYEELQGEDFAGEPCRVLQSAGRSERLWVSTTTGRLKAVLTFGMQGFRTPFHKQPIVAEIVGQPVETTDEYRELVGKLSKAKNEQLGIARSEYAFQHAIPWHLYEFDDYREIAPGSWFPFKVRSAGWSHNDKNEQYYSFYNSESVVDEVRTDREDLKSVWLPLLPEDGDKIQDQRFDVPVEYEYRRDRTDDEVATLVNDAIFEQAKSAMSWAKRRSPLNTMLGKPAIKLPIDGWIGQQPDLQRPELTGKPYLLHFWAAWCGPCKNDIPWLNEIAKNSIVIGVHPAGTSESEIHKCIADEKMTYPTIVSETGSSNPLGYPVSMYPYCIKVDEKGNVVQHGFLRDVLGAAPPNPISNEVEADPKVAGIAKVINAEDALVLFSLGENDGIELQQTLDVVRDGKRIGQLRVVFVKDDQSVGKIDRKEEVVQIKVGDTVQ